MIMMEQNNKKENAIVTYLKNQSKKDKIILTSTIIILAIVFGLKFAVLPQLENYSNNLLKLDGVRAEQQSLAVVTKENQLLTEKAEKLNLEYEKAIEQLPKTPAVAQIIYDLNDLVKRSDVELGTLSFSEVEVAEGDITTNADGTVTEIDRGLEGTEESDPSTETQQKVKKQVVNISLLGEYQNVIKFVKAVENYSRIAEVSNISFSKGQNNLLSVSLTANFYNLNYEEKENYDFNKGTYGKEDSFN